MNHNTDSRDPSEHGRSPRIIAEVGGLPDETTVTLGIHGPDLDPDEISGLLGTAPTTSHRRGEAQSRGPARRQGAWLLRAEATAPDGPDDLLQRLLAALPDDAAIWARLTDAYTVRVGFGIFIGTWNRGFELSPASIQRLTRMGVGVGFDIYCDGEQADASPTVT